MVLKKIALTGASGMVGRHVIDVLNEKGITCSASSLKPQPKSLLSASSWNEWDLTKWKTPDQLNNLFGEIDALLHVGAIVPFRGHHFSNRAVFDANIRACLCLAEWALKIDIPVVFLSGSTVYADPDKLNILETDPTTVHNIGGMYGFSKLLGEQVFQHFKNDGLKLCILRASSIYGYGLPDDKMVAKFLDELSRDETLTLFQPVESKVDLIHASVVANAMLDVLDQEAWGVYNIASGELSSVLKIAEICQEIVGKGELIVKTKTSVNLPFTRFNLNTDSANSRFGFSNRITLKQGIKKMWENIKACS